MTIQVPQGFRLSGVHCGIKRNPNKPDMSLIVSDHPATAAGVYTQNLVHAAPVALNRQRTPTDQFRVLVINSGNANACTGERGLNDARQMATMAAAACDVEGSHALVMSTGVIGDQTSMRSGGVLFAVFVHPIALVTGLSTPNPTSVPPR